MIFSCIFYHLFLFVDRSEIVYVLAEFFYSVSVVFCKIADDNFLLAKTYQLVQFL